MTISTRSRALAGAVATLAGLASLTNAQAASSGWVSTATQAIPLVSATKLGNLNPATSIRIAVALKMQNASTLESLVQQQTTPGNANYEKFITPAQFNATYAPSAASITAVRSYLSKQGFSSIKATPNGLFVTATGTTAQVEAAFNTTLTWFKQNNASIYVNTTPAQVPSSLNGIVISVLGLNNVSALAKTETPCTLSSPACVRLEYDPASYWAAYHTGAVPAASNATIAVMAEGDVSQVPKDLVTFEQSNSLPQVPVTVVQVGLWSPDTSGQDEWDLDTQYTTGMAGNAKQLYIYDTTSLTDQDTALEFNHWASDDLAVVANASFSICEFFPYLDGTMVADDQVFLEAAAQGQTMFAATGDTGSFCSVGTPNGVPAGAPFVGYPATSPYVVAVGGTTLLTNADGVYKDEVSWYAGGGGISQFEYTPYWQSGIVPTNNPNVPESFRGVPDIAMDADPNTGAEVVVSGSVEIVGGTSLSSPLAVGSYARLQSAHKNMLGFASPVLYSGYPQTGTLGSPQGTWELEDGFRDVLTGTDGLYTALPGYDYTTGLGSFDIAKKNAVLPKP